MAQEELEEEDSEEFAEAEPLQFTFHAPLDLPPLGPAVLKAMGLRFNDVEHKLWAGFQAKKPLSKKQSLKDFGILGRNYNSCLSRVKGDRKAIQARQKEDLVKLKNKIATKERIRDQSHGYIRECQLKTNLDKLIQVKNKPFKAKTKKDLDSLDKKISKTTKAWENAKTPGKANDLKTKLEELNQERATSTKPLNEKDLASLNKKISKVTKALKKAGDKTLLYQKTQEINKLHRKLAELEDDIKNDHQKLTFGTNKLFRSQFYLKENGIKDHQEWKENWLHARSSNFSQLGSKDETAGNQVCQQVINPDETTTLTITLPPFLVEKYGETLVIPNIKWNYGREAIFTALQSCQSRKAAKSQSWSLLHEDTKELILKPVSTIDDPWELDERKVAVKAYQEPFKDLGQAIFYRFIEDKKGRWKIYASTGIGPGKPCTSDKFGVVGSDLNEDHIALIDINHEGNYIGGKRGRKRGSKRISYCFYGLSSEQREAEVERVAIEIVAWAKGKKKYLILEDLDFESLKAKIGKTNPTRARYLHALPYAALREAIVRRAHKEGVEVKFVDPAYGSVIGKFKFQKMYGLSSHASAALVNGRRYSKFSERPVSFQKFNLFLGQPNPKILSLPVWNEGEDQRRWWLLVRRRLIGAVAPLSWARMRPMEPVPNTTCSTGRALPRKDSQDITGDKLVPSCSHRSDDP